MKKVVHTEEYGLVTGEKTLVGFKEEINWSVTAHCRGPRGYGEFTVSDGDGKTYTRNYCERGSKLAIEILENGYTEGATFSDSDSQLSNDEIIELYHSFQVWYYTEEVGYYDDYQLKVIICRGGAIPKYFLDSTITGPIDSEIGTYEETEYKFK